jgi:YebC/PmpR family DNA-binding regulatory protein
MGRIFETRKHTMFARWDRMAKQFTRIGKEIVIAVKAGGPDPASNPQLRRVIQNARAVNMPKDKVEAAIKRAAGKEAANYEEILYEGYAPHGVAVLIEAATDNPTRTVSNLRNHFNKGGGNLGAAGSVGFLFKRTGAFRLDPAGIDQDELEIELIDHGLEEMGEGTGEKGEPQLVIRCAFADFGRLQKAIEDRRIKPLSAESEYIPLTPLALSDDQAKDVLKLVDTIEQDDDVQRVFHNLS